jgi:hypothetical protein
MQAKDLLSHHIPGADGWMEVTMDIYDISRRIREGDESGWRGDPTASVMFNPLTQQFEVWLIDDHNTPYIACSGPRCDHSLIVKLIEGDWQKGKKLLEEIQKKNRQAQEARLTADRDRAEEIADKMHFAIIKDLGHLEGGTRRQYSMNTNKK